MFQYITLKCLKFSSDYFICIVLNMTGTHLSIHIIALPYAVLLRIRSIKLHSNLETPLKHLATEIGSLMSLQLGT